MIPLSEAEKVELKLATGFHLKYDTEENLRESFNCFLVVEPEVLDRFVTMATDTYIALGHRAQDPEGSLLHSWLVKFNNLIIVRTKKPKRITNPFMDNMITNGVIMDLADEAVGIKFGYTTMDPATKDFVDESLELLHVLMYQNLTKE